MEGGGMDAGPLPTSLIVVVVVETEVESASMVYGAICYGRWAQVGAARRAQGADNHLSGRIFTPKRPFSAFFACTTKNSYLDKY